MCDSFYFSLIQSAFFNRLVSERWPPMTTSTCGSWPVHNYTVAAMHAMAFDPIKQRQRSPEEKNKISCLTPVSHSSSVLWARRQPKDGEHREKKSQRPLTSIVHLKAVHGVNGISYTASRKWDFTLDMSSSLTTSREESDALHWMSSSPAQCLLSCAVVQMHVVDLLSLSASANVSATLKCSEWEAGQLTIHQLRIHTRCAHLDR